MKKFLNLIISAVLIFPTGIIFNDNQTKFVSISNNDLEFNIEKFEIYERDLAGFVDQHLGPMKIIDLTSVTGISSIEIFKKFYSKVELPGFYAGVELFNTTPQVHSLSISTEEWKEDWISKSITLVAGNESIGSAYIDGILKARLEIQKHLDLHHLLLRINFYGSGNFESTAKHPIGEIISGWVMKLVTT